MPAEKLYGASPSRYIPTIIDGNCIYLDPRIFNINQPAGILDPLFVQNG
jgi:hypothetical protein